MTTLTLTVAASAGTGGGGGLGLLVLIGLLAWLFSSGGGGQAVRWEYTQPNGSKATTPWYDDGAYIIEEPGGFTVYDRDGRPATPYRGRVVE